MNAEDTISVNSFGEEDVSVSTSMGDDLSSFAMSWTEDYETTCWDEPDFHRPRTPYSPPIPEYSGLKLEILSKPEFISQGKKDGDTWGIALKRRSTRRSPTKDLATLIKEQEQGPPSPSNSNPWKKVEVVVRKDPWAFLEEKKPKCVPPPSRSPNVSSTTRPHRDAHYQQQQRPQQPSTKKSPTHSSSSPSSKSSKDNSKLCKYKNECRMNRDGRCTMVHTLKEWCPRLCKFNTRCNKKMNCGYYHQDIPLKDFLSHMIKKKDTIYQKNSSFYEKYLSSG